jgi:hypothetical protein
MTHFLQFIRDFLLFFYLLLFIITIINAFNRKSLFRRIPEENENDILSFRMLLFVIVYFIGMPLFIIWGFFVNVYKLLLDDEK